MQKVELQREKNSTIIVRDLLREVENIEDIHLNDITSLT